MIMGLNEYGYYGEADLVVAREKNKRMMALRDKWLQERASELEPSDNADIWNWYHNQRGGSCNG